MKRVLHQFMTKLQTTQSFPPYNQFDFMNEVASFSCTSTLSESTALRDWPCTFDSNVR